MNQVIPSEPRFRGENTHRAFTNLDDYAQAHGSTGEVFRASGWTETIHKKRPALAFVTDTGIRYRFIDGADPRYTSPAGYKACLYRWREAAQLAIETGRVPVLCNGEASTVIGQSYKIPALCVTGGEKGKITPDVLYALLGMFQIIRERTNKQPEMVIAFDCDKAGIDAALSLANQLSAIGFKVTALDLGGSEHSDLADLCKVYGESAPDVLYQCPPLLERLMKRWRLVPASDLKIEPIRWLIDKIIPEIGVCMLCGDSASGKSFIAVHWALTIAQTHPVVYVVGEGILGFPKRLKAWELHFKKGYQNVTICDGTPLLLNDGDLGEFIEKIAVLSPKLVVIDTMARAMIGGNENDAGDIGAFMLACTMIQRRINGVVLLVHHFGKQGMIERGSSNIRASLETMFFTRRDDVVITLECIKSKDDEEPAPESYTLLSVTVQEGITSCVIVPAEGVKQTKGDPLSRNQRKVVTALLLESMQDATPQEIAEYTGLKREGVQTILSRLMTLGFVTRTQREESTAYQYCLTAEAKKRFGGDQGDQPMTEPNQPPDHPSPSGSDQGDPSDQPLSQSSVNDSQKDGDHLDHPDQVDHPLSSSDTGEQPALFPLPTIYP